jgi:hypothetical protein
MNEKNVIIAGVPRSGTTLTCFLLNKLANTVALDEPFGNRVFVGLADNDAICREIAQFFEKSRESLLTNGTALSKHVAGKVPDNIIGDEYDQYDDLRLRRGISKTGVIAIEKQLSSDFLLVIKQVAIFAAILDRLVDYFPCFAVMRNPLAVLRSWNSIRLPYHQGRVPPAERLDSSLTRALDLIEDRFDRQLYLLSWFYEKINTLIPRNAVLLYEDIIPSGGKALRLIAPDAETLNESLESRNDSKLYDSELKLFLGEKLLQSDGAYWQFYSKESVELLMKDS